MSKFQTYIFRRDIEVLEYVYCVVSSGNIYSYTLC